MRSRFPSAKRSPQVAARQRLYKTKRWKEIRARVLGRYPRCVDCGGEATIADHSLGHDGDDWLTRFWNESFIVGRCRPCHSVKTTTQEQGRGRHGRGFGRSGAPGKGGGADATSGQGAASHKGLHEKRQASLPEGKPLEAALKLLNSELKI